jgi:hypothetical protein
MKGQLVTGAIGILLGASAVLGMQGTSASTPPSAPPGGSALTTLTIVLKNSTVHALDLAPKGPSQGDMRIITGPLFAPGGTRPIGRTDLFCTVTDPGNMPTSKLQQTECLETFTLPGGTITAHGLHARTALSAHALPFADAVTGGTGSYLGARGDLRGATRGNETTFTVRLLGSK